MQYLLSILSLLKRVLLLDEASVLAAERRREEAFLAEAADIYELEARQRAWQTRSRLNFPV